jgi:hypothetical protein
MNQIRILPLAGSVKILFERGHQSTLTTAESTVCSIRMAVWLFVLFLFSEQLPCSALIHDDRISTLVQITHSGV